MTRTLEETRERHAKELRDIERVETLRALLPDTFRADASIVLFGNNRKGRTETAGVSIGKRHNTNRTLPESLAIVGTLAEWSPPVESQRWRAGCLEVAPEALNTYATKESATMDGAHVVELEVSGGRGFGPDAVFRMWHNTNGEWMRTSVAFAAYTLAGCVPSITGSYDRNGSYYGTIARQYIGEDARINWWSELPSHQTSYYWADWPNFLAWASNHTPKPAE